MPALLGSTIAAFEICLRLPCALLLFSESLLKAADDMGFAPQYVMWDKVTEFTVQFDEMFKNGGTEIERTVLLSPGMRAHGERVIHRLKFDVLVKFAIESNMAPERCVPGSATELQSRPPRKARGYLPLGMEQPPESINAARLNDVIYSLRLDGLLKHGGWRDLQSTWHRRLSGA